MFGRLHSCLLLLVICSLIIVCPAVHATHELHHDNRVDDTHVISDGSLHSTDDDDTTMDDESGDVKSTSDMLNALSDSERDTMKQTLEKSFLQMFGLSSRPRFKNKQVHIPQYMLELYEQHMSRDSEYHEQHQRRRGGRRKVQVHDANTIRSFYYTDSDETAEASSPSDDTDDNHVHFSFDVTSLPHDEMLVASELRLYRRGVNATAPGIRPLTETSHLAQSRHRIDVYDVIKPGRKGRREPILRLLDTRVVDPRVSAWETFDVSPALAAWHGRPALNHGLIIRFSELDGRRSKLSHVRLKRSPVELTRNVESEDEEEVESWEDVKPLLVVYSNNKQRGDIGGDKASPRRTRRSTKERRNRRANKKRSNRRKRCKRRPLYVDFRDVGWDDWIVAPPGYRAYYCQGACPFPLADHLNATNHAIVQSLVNSVNSQSVPPPCCVPTELSQISLLYLNENGRVVLKNYNDMVVEACGCR